MKNINLINYHNQKLNFEKGSKIIFRNEYLLLHYDKEKLKNYKFNSLESLKKVFNKNKDEKLIKSKLKKYRYHLAKFLNKIHDINFTNQDWGILLDYYLMVSILIINLKIKNFKKIKNNKISCEVSKRDFFFLDTKTFKDEILLNQDLNKYIDYLILNKLGFKNLKIEKKKPFRRLDKPRKLLIDKLIDLILKIFPKYSQISLISSGYLGFKNCLLLFFRSKFKILFVNSGFFDLNGEIKTIKNSHRKNIIIPESDILDRVFNEFNRNVLPSCFFENFDKFYKFKNNIAKKIKNLGSAVLFLESDVYRFFAMKIKKQGGKLINFQHGGLNRMRKFSLEEHLVDNYANIDFWWHDAKGIGAPYFNNINNIKKNIGKKKILLFPTVNLYQETTVNLKRCNHVYLNQYWKFFELIKDNLKKEVKIKFLEYKNSKLLKQMWVNKYNKNIILEKKSYKGSIFQDFKIVVIDNFSTPLFELLYKSYPFIIINDSNLSEYKNEFKSIVKNLEKLGILFTSEKRAAQFLNFNYQNIESWWKKTTEKKQFIQIKKKLFPIKKFDQLKLIDILKK